MHYRNQVAFLAAILTVFPLLAQATPVDVNGDGTVGPQELIDLSVNWKGLAGIQPWQIDGTNIFYNSGNVGIGTVASTVDRLDVSGGGSIGTTVFRSASKGPNLSHVHYGPLGDWYIRSAASTGKVFLQDTGGTVGIGTIMTTGYKVTVENNAGGAVLGYSNSAGADGVAGTADGNNGTGVRGIADLGSDAWGIYGRSTSGLAGYFEGKVLVTGNLEKPAGSFKIDHPLDPANKYLSHSFVESPDMMNIYNGNVVTDASGYATVTLPDWFDALNKDFRYQLTVLDDSDSDEFVWAKIVKKLQGNQFTIRASRPHLGVSWQVTGIRKDPYAEAHRIQVEEEKPAAESGRFLHPELYGKSEDYAVNAEKRKAMSNASSGSSTK